MQEILQELYQHLNHLIDICDFTSVRAKCVFGTLKCVVSRIRVSANSLDWLIEHNRLLLKLCKCFHLLVEHKIGNVEETLDIRIVEFLEQVNSSEIEGVLIFCHDLQTILQGWKAKVDVLDVTESDINRLRNHYHWFNDICKFAYATTACIDEQKVRQLELSYVLLQHIPGLPELKW